jgi:hypothetical protein
MEYILRWENESVRDKYFALRDGRSEDKELYKSIERKLDILKFNPYRGDNIEKKKIPGLYIRKYHLNNLLKININRYWRLLYHVKSLDRDRTLVIVIDFMTHRDYDRLFGYS